jgi:hypothetical protein
MSGGEGCVQCSRNIGDGPINVTPSEKKTN